MADQVIVRDPDVMSGTPCFRGTRVPFKNLIDYLEGGHSLSEFLQQFPTVTLEMAVQALEEAKESLFAKIASRSYLTNACRWISGIAFLATTRIVRSGLDSKAKTTASC